MKSYLWSMKLAAATALLVASAALAAPEGKQQTEPSQDQPTGNAMVELLDGVSLQTGPEKELPTDLLQHEPSDKTLLAAPGHLRPLASASAYWLGVKCGPAPAALREHLGLTPGQGLLVFEVVPGAPAAQAGIVETDVLLAANGATLAGVVDLIKVVDAAKNQPIAFDVIHQGKKSQVTITPQANPHRPPADQPGAKQPSYAELDRIYEWFEQQHPGQSIRPRMRLRFMHPGVLLPPDASLYPALPGGMSITIAKQGDQPARITVTRGEDIWKVDEKSIDQLPEDVRPHVERMLHGLVAGPEMPRLDYLPDWTGPRKLGDPSEAGSALRDRIEAQMERMNRRLEEMQKRLEGLRGTPGPEEEKK
ncbi:MAG: PDZ domain-containing protein [Pirellulales bacterium]|nr:PDZ domain-containing protein [Pirellulales bacterium]